MAHKRIIQVTFLIAALFATFIAFGDRDSAVFTTKDIPYWNDPGHTSAQEFFGVSGGDAGYMGSLDAYLAGVSIDANYINVLSYGAVAGSAGAAATNDTAFAAAVVAAGADGSTIFIPHGTYYTSALWHINLPVSIVGDGSTIIGGDADGVIWYGYRTGANQNSYFQSKFIRNLTVTSTTAGADGFTSSKTLESIFDNLRAEDCTGNGLVFKALVSSEVRKPVADNNDEHGILLTYFTNSDGTTDVPTTANLISAPYVRSNGTTNTHYGMLFDIDTDPDRAAYYNWVVGGNVELNPFTGVRMYGINTLTNMYFSNNGQSAGTLNQYHLWITDADDVLINDNLFGGIGIDEKVYIDGSVDNPIFKNNEFISDSQSDIAIGGTVTGLIADRSNRWSANGLPIDPNTYDKRWELPINDSGSAAICLSTSNVSGYYDTGESECTTFDSKISGPDISVDTVTISDNAFPLLSLTRETSGSVTIRMTDANSNVADIVQETNLQLRATSNQSIILMDSTNTNVYADSRGLTLEKGGVVFPVLAAAVSTVEGTVAYANSTNWNPGSGEGLYVYSNGGWEKLH